MNPIANRKIWAAFMNQLKEQKPLTCEQFSHLALVFEEILNGVDANEALGLKYKRGNKEADGVARNKISLVLHWVAGAISPKAEGGLGFTIDKACEEAANEFDSLGYSPEVIRKYWYQKDKAHMQSALRNTFDPDSPY